MGLSCGWSKQSQFENMQQSMTKSINANHNKVKMKREFKQEKNEYFDIQLGDCVQLIKLSIV